MAGWDDTDTIDHINHIDHEKITCTHHCCFRELVDIQCSHPFAVCMKNTRERDNDIESNPDLNDRDTEKNMKRLNDTRDYRTFISKYYACQWWLLQ